MAKFTCKKKGMKMKMINGGIVKLMIANLEKLQKNLLLGKKLISSIRVQEGDVKEGHFVVIAEDDDELKRFVVPLRYLAHPSFLRLLEQAAEEYGFNHDGALTVPCSPCELERILAERDGRAAGRKKLPATAAN